MKVSRACVPFEYIDQQRSCRPLHRLNIHPYSGRYIGSELAYRVEVENSFNDLVRRGGTGTDQDGESIQRRVDEQSVTELELVFFFRATQMGHRDEKYEPGVLVKDIE
jgi:hypothetical protein